MEKHDVVETCLFSSVGLTMLEYLAGQDRTQFVLFEYLMVLFNEKWYALL